MYTPKYYPPAEEKFNIISHGIGFILSIIGLVFLVWRAVEFGDFWHILSVSIYGVSMAILYAASTLFHSAKKLTRRRLLNIFDHAAIYVFIAGSYTPFTLITLPKETGWWLFGIVWAIAFVGVILKLFFTGKYDRLSTAMYVLMGWLILFAINPLRENIAQEGLTWLMTGGVFYTIGAIFYSMNKMNFNHAIFHVFVLLGSFCQFVSIYFYVLPGG